MLARTVLSLANLVAMTATFVVWLLYPQYSMYALYAAVVWIGIAFALIYTSWGGRPLGTNARATGAGASGGSGAGVARAATAPSSSEIGFCVYCAADLPRGATRCRECGHAVQIR